MFDNHALAWVRDLSCLKRCGFSIAEMKSYLALCLEGQASIPARTAMLDAKRHDLTRRIAELQDSIAYIDEKQDYYDGVLSGRLPYMSNLIAST